MKCQKQIHINSQYMYYAQNILIGGWVLEGRPNTDMDESRIEHKSRRCYPVSCRSQVTCRFPQVTRICWEFQQTWLLYISAIQPKDQKMISSSQNITCFSWTSWTWELRRLGSHPVRPFVFWSSQILISSHVCLSSLSSPFSQVGIRANQRPSSHTVSHSWKRLQVYK